jgi:hypothetical protein
VGEIGGQVATWGGREACIVVEIPIMVLTPLLLNCFTTGPPLSIESHGCEEGKKKVPA